MTDIKSKQKSASKPVISNKFPIAFSQVGSEKPIARSPLKAEKKETIKLSKVLKHLDKMPSQSTEKLFQPYSKLKNNISKLPYFPVHLEEMITLSQISSTSLASSVRKVFHAGTFAMFSIKQIPITTRSERNCLRTYIDKWGTFRDPVFVKVIETFWNIPEGCVSIVSEYCNGSSLTDLCRNIGSVPEKALSEIARSLLTSMSILNDSNETIDSISISDVLFNHQGALHILPSLSTQVQEKAYTSPLYSIGQTLIKAIFDEFSETTSQNCCLFHSLEPNPITSRLSEPLQDFLCSLTSYKSKGKIENFLLHKWLRLEEYIGPDVSLQELIAIGYQKEEYWSVGDMQLNRICEALKVVLVGKKFKRPSSSAIHALSEEIAVPKEVFMEKLLKVYEDIS